MDNYEAEEDDEISFKRGAIVDVLQKSMDGWWLVRINKAVGLAPATFLKKVEVQELDNTSQVCCGQGGLTLDTMRQLSVGLCLAACYVDCVSLV